MKSNTINNRGAVSATNTNGLSFEDKLRYNFRARRERDEDMLRSREATRPVYESTRTDAEHAAHRAAWPAEARRRAIQFGWTQAELQEAISRYK